MWVKALLCLGLSEAKIMFWRLHKTSLVVDFTELLTSFAAVDRHCRRRRGEFRRLFFVIRHNCGRRAVSPSVSRAPCFFSRRVRRRVQGSAANPRRRGGGGRDRDQDAEGGRVGEESTGLVDGGERHGTVQPRQRHPAARSRHTQSSDDDHQ